MIMTVKIMTKILMGLMMSLMMRPVREISRQLLVTESENLQWVSLSQGLGVVLGMLETFKNNKYENLPPIPGPRGWGGWDLEGFLLKILLENI